MSFLDNIKSIFNRNSKALPVPQLTKSDASKLVERALESQAEKYEKELQELRNKIEPIRGYRRNPNEFLASPRGYGAGKPFGVPYRVLRGFMRLNPTLHTVVSIRKREIASAGWDIVPDLEKHQKELETLAALMHSIREFPERAGVLERWKACYISEDMTRELIEATRSPDLFPSEVRTRFYYAISDLRMLAEQHAYQARRLFSRPNNQPHQRWEAILSQIVEDILTLDVSSIELRRVLFPLDPAYPVEQLVPRHDNRIVELYAIDPTTIRPCYDEHGQLMGEEDPYQTAYEQWIDDAPVEYWQRNQLLYFREHPTTDINMKGYTYSRTESLFDTMMLMAKEDQASWNELKRDFFGGFLWIGQEGEQTDLHEIRQYIEAELEGDKKLPLLAGQPQKPEFVSTTPTQSSSGANRRIERSQEWKRRVAAKFEFPLLKLGEADKTNYRNSDIGSDMMDDGFRSLAILLDRTITQGIVWESGHRDIAYKTAPNHERDREKQLDNLERLANIGGADINDIRSELGKPPTQDGERSIHEWRAYGEAKGKSQGEQAGSIDVDPVTPEIEQKPNDLPAPSEIEEKT